MLEPPRAKPASKATKLVSTATKPSGKRSDASYFCMNAVDEVKCFEKVGFYDCWHYHPVYDYRKGEQIMRREKVASVPEIYAVIMSTRVDDKDKMVKIVTKASNVRCYVTKKDMTCINPAADEHDLGKFPCQ